MTEQDKTNLTAVVIIPPEDVCEPIQAIRRRHDPQINRWMPHVTMLYPFVPEVHFDEAAARVTAVCRKRKPFALRLVTFGSFEHSPRSATLWLDPKPGEPVAALQAELEAAYPHCDDVSRFSTGYTPHLSVGRFPGRQAVEEALDRFRFAWMPLDFTVAAVHIIARSGDPDDPFRIRRTIPLGEFTAGGSRGQT